MMNVHWGAVEFADRKKSDDQPQERVIESGTMVVGDITFTGQLTVDGAVRGNVSAATGQAATLIIGEKGRVSGNIEVTHLVIRGCVDGRLSTANLVEVHAKAQASCDLVYFEIEMHSGAVVEGRLVPRGELVGRRLWPH